MPLGDLLQRLALGETLSPGEANELRLEFNNLQTRSSQLAALLTNTGALDPNIFLRSGQFSVLPHEAIYLEKGASTQTLTTGTIATLTSWALTGSNGLKWDSANSRVLLSGVSKESYYAIGLQASFEANATGFRQLLLLTRDASAGAIAQYNLGKIPAVATGGETTVVNGSTVYAMFSDEASLEIQALQNSGGDLDITNVNLWVVRIR